MMLCVYLKIYKGYNIVNRLMFWDVIVHFCLYLNVCYLLRILQ